MRIRGIHFVPAEPISEEAKIKIENIIAKKKARLEKIVSDYKLGKL